MQLNLTSYTIGPKEKAPSSSFTRQRTPAQKNEHKSERNKSDMRTKTTSHKEQLNKERQNFMKHSKNRDSKNTGNKKAARQLDMLPKAPKQYGGVYRNNAKNRGERPLASNQTIHLVMRSTKATGTRSFTRHRALVKGLVESQAKNANVRVISWANVGNHVHMHIQLPRIFRVQYTKFIRGLTGAIALKIMAANRLNKVVRETKDRFWDQRPFTRVLTSWREHVNLRHYIQTNHFEGLGFERNEAGVRAYVHDAGFG